MNKNRLLAALGAAAILAPAAAWADPIVRPIGNQGGFLALSAPVIAPIQPGQQFVIAHLATQGSAMQLVAGKDGNAIGASAAYGSSTGALPNLGVAVNNGPQARAQVGERVLLDLP